MHEELNLLVGDLLIAAPNTFLEGFIVCPQFLTDCPIGVKNLLTSPRSPSSFLLYKMLKRKWAGNQLYSNRARGFHFICLLLCCCPAWPDSEKSEASNFFRNWFQVFWKRLTFESSMDLFFLCQNANFCFLYPLAPVARCRLFTWQISPLMYSYPNRILSKKVVWYRKSEIAIS